MKHVTQDVFNVVTYLQGYGFTAAQVRSIEGYIAPYRYANDTIDMFTVGCQVDRIVNEHGELANNTGSVIIGDILRYYEENKS